MSLRATRLLIGLRLRRQRNMLSGGLRFLTERRGHKKTGARRATAGKRGGGRLLTFLFLPLMLLVTIQTSVHVIRNLNEHLATGVVVAGGSVDVGALAGAAVLLALAWAALLALNMVDRGSLARPEWDLEWLAALPVPMDALLGARIAERTVVNALAWAVFLSFTGTLSWQAGARWSAPVLAVVASGVLVLLMATCRTMLETMFRLRYAPGTLRNIQAACTLISLPTLYLAMAAATAAGRAPDFLVYQWARALPAWFAATPFALAAELAGSTDPLHALVSSAGLTAWAVGGTAVSLAVVRHALRHGLVSGGARESSRNDRREVTTATGRRRILTPVQAKELRLLRRDRTFMMQTVAVPVLIIGAQVLFNPGMVDSLLHDPRHLGALAFGVAAYTLCFSAFQTLNAEGETLWLLYALPGRLDRLVLDKGMLWGTLVLIYPLLMVAIMWAANGEVTGDTLAIAALVVASLPIYAVIASCMGVLACRPFEADRRRRIDPVYLYLFMILMSFCTYAIYASELWPRLVLLGLSALLGLALWQKARDRLPYLLDPTEETPPGVSLADGLIAAQVFFVIQGVIMLAVKVVRDDAAEGAAAAGDLGGIPPAGWLLIAFSIAGGITWAAARLIFRRRRLTRTLGLPGIWSALSARATVPAIVVGLALGGVGLGYVLLVKEWSFLPQSARDAMAMSPSGGLWLVGVAVIAAPLFEEFLFRGLVFAGMRRTFGLWPSVLGSAAVFAVMHPAVSVPPVFVVGVVTALAYEKTRGLWAPMLIHAAYNGVVVGAQLLGT